MEYGEVVRRRRMVRQYQSGRPVPPEVRDAVLDAARRAPSAGFSQGVSFLVLESEQNRALFWDCTAGERPADRWLAGMQTAPMLIMIWTSEDAYRQRYGDVDKVRTDQAELADRSGQAPSGRTTSRPSRVETWAAPFWYVDAGMAAMAALHAVVDATAGSAGSALEAGDLGACFFGIPVDRVESVRNAFGVPTDQLAVGVISVGYRAVGEVAAGSPTRRARKPATAVVHLGRW